MIYIFKAVLLMCSFRFLYKTIKSKNTRIAYGHLYSATLIGLLAILIRPIV